MIYTYDTIKRLLLLLTVRITP